VKIITSFLCLFILFGIFSPVFGQGTVKIEDLLTNPNLSAAERDKIAKLLTSQPTGKGVVIETLANSDKWREIGQAFAETVKQVCNTLNVEVNQFIKSDVGKLTAGIILWKMIGKDLIRVVVLSFFLFCLTIVIFSSIYFVHGRKKVKTIVDGKEQITYRDRWIDWNGNSDARIISVVVHLIAWFATNAICVANMI
jgi:hypothetical protein